MFGRASKQDTLFPQLSFQPSSYQAQIQAKLAELQDMVEAHLVDAARAQKSSYDTHSSLRSFQPGDLVWLSVPTAGKLDPRWDGCWKVKSIKSPINMEITDGMRNRVVHVNRLRHRVQPHSDEAQAQPMGSTSDYTH